MKIRLEYEIDYDLWCEKEILDKMTDKEVFELLEEDWYEVISKAERTVIRD